VLPWAGAATLVAGLALAADAVVRGNASAYLVLIVPVVAGSSLEFFGAVVLIVLGLGLIFSGSATWEGDGGEEPSPPHPPTSRSGGVLLLGPLPIFFGSWRASGPRARWAWSAAGAAILVVLVVLVVVYGFVLGGW
jgi:uncharacterized membrane protein